MFWCNKLYYIIVVGLIELLNTGAMVSKRSLILATQSVDDLRSLELCTARNQQRLGNVFGNFTRHHKKGHRRKTTTESFMSTTNGIVDNNEFITSTETASTVQSTKIPYPELQPLRLVNKDYLNDMFNIENLLEQEMEHRDRERHFKHRKRSQEFPHRVDESSFHDNLHRVKKMYRESSSSSNVNKLNSNKNGKGGIFLTENCTTVIAQIGTTAVLHCEVSDITENTVTWIRRKDYSLLSVGLVTYSADNRFFSAHGRHVKDWALHIRFATSVDGGYYECQVPTHPPTSIFFKLVLVAAYAEIMGESEKIVHEGSMLRLVCVVRRSTEPPSYVFWYFENRMINYDLNGVSVHNGRQSSELVIGKAQPRHAGNYTCVPANAKAASVTVHVVQSETPAAMQHGNNSSAKIQKVHKCFILQALIIVVIYIDLR